MSVLIKGMDMPESCMICPYHACLGALMDEYGMLGAIDEVSSRTHNLNGRAKDCPLVEVPKHGRLIDADKLMELAQNYISKSVDCNDIARFPTVIEAEE